MRMLTAQVISHNTSAEKVSYQHGTVVNAAYETVIYAHLNYPARQARKKK